MPVRDGLPASERGRHIPPRDTTAGPPEHPVEHRAVIGPPPTTTRDLVGQQRLHPGPFRIGQIVSMQHPPGLPHPALKIRGTRSNPTPGPGSRWLAFSPGLLWPIAPGWRQVTPPARSSGTGRYPNLIVGRPTGRPRPSIAPMTTVRCRT